MDGEPVRIITIMRKLTAFLIALCCIFSNRPAWGWIDTGHKIIAFIAWEQLTPRTRAAVLDMLKEHPGYEKDLIAYPPEDATPDQLDRHVFAAASTWPDLIRFPDHPMHATHSHSSWHYIDIPFSVGGQPTLPEKTADATGPQNLVEAMAKNMADLKSAALPPSEKAIALCWVCHLVGDIHQPLHTASMYSPQFPRGDQGGNAEAVLRDAQFADTRIKLHLLWDELPGEFKSEFLEGYEAAGIRSDPQYSRKALKDALTVTDFAAWAKESQALAVKYAYLDGTLQTAPAHEGRGSDLTPVPALPPGYLKQAERIATRQLALAGDRLADLLNATFDSK
jgi:hypothetical protein